MPIERGTSQMQLHEYLEGEMTFENPIKPTKLLSTVYCTCSSYSHLSVVSPSPGGSVAIRFSIKTILTLGLVPALYQLELHLFGHFQSLLLHQFLHCLKSVLSKLDPLVGVANAGVLHHGPEHHEEADEQVDVNGLHVGDLGQGGVDRVDEGGHGEHGGHPQPHPGRGRASVEPEAHPGHHHDQAARDVNLHKKKFCMGGHNKTDIKGNSMSK